MQRISGPGVPLPYPQNLYPTELANAPYDVPTNSLGLAPGDAVVIPPGDWVIEPGAVSMVQYLDPVTGGWKGYPSARNQYIQLFSDGETRRIANLTGCPVGAVIAGGGTGFTQSTATITANVGGSTWQAIVGGALSVSTISNAGKGYTVPPVVFIPAPPSPGVPATAHAVLTGTSVTSVVLDNVGAGYTSAPTAVILPNEFDPNAGSVTNATVVLVLNAALSGAITAAIPTYNGEPPATLSALTLTAAGGAGSGATITPVIMQSLVSLTATGGTGWGTAAAPPLITTAGGLPASVSAIGNPSVEFTGYKVRQAQVNVTSSSVGVISAPVIMDPGLFVGTPTACIIPSYTAQSTIAAATIAFTMGGINDTVFMQPL